MSTSSCRFCPHVNPAGAKFCSECGSPLHVKPCPKCEAICDLSAGTCYQCGASFEAERVPDAAVEAAPQSAAPAERIETTATAGSAHVPESLAERLDEGSSRAARTGAFQSPDFYRAAAAVIAILAIGTAAYHIFDATADRSGNDATVIGQEASGVAPATTPAAASVDDRASVQAPPASAGTHSPSPVVGTDAETAAAAAARQGARKPESSSVLPEPRRTTAQAQTLRSKPKPDAAAIATQRLIDRDMSGYAQQQGSPRMPSDRDASETQRLIARDLGKFLPPNSNARAAGALPEIN